MITLGGILYWWYPNDDFHVPLAGADSLSVAEFTGDFTVDTGYHERGELN